MGGSVAVTPDLATPTGIPGATSHATPTSADAIGDAYIEGHGKCAAGGPGCFLAPSERAALVEGYKSRVTAAQTMFTTALSQIRVDELIQKDEDLPLWIGLMFDVIGALAVDGIRYGVTLARQASGDDHHSTMDAMIAFQTAPHDTSRTSARTLVQNINPETVAAIARAGIGQAKPAVKAQPRSDKGEKLGYLEQLEVSSAIAWQQQREAPPSMADDGELIVLFHSFDARAGHNVPAYKAALEDKIRRYMASAASRIGRVHTNGGKDADVADRGTEGFVMRDTKVVWVQHHDHLPPTLYYEKRDASDNNNDYTRDHLDVTPLDAETQFHLTAPVEPEFIETAIARHTETWGAAPEVYEIDAVPAPWAGAKATAASAPLPADNKVAPGGLGLPAPLLGAS